MIKKARMVIDKFAHNLKHVSKGFSLVELMIVVGIIGVLASLTIQSYKTYLIRSKILEVIKVMESYKAMLLEKYNAGGFPIGGTLTTASSKYVSDLSYGTANSECVWIMARVTDAVGLPTYPAGQEVRRSIIMFLRAEYRQVVTYCGQWDSGGPGSHYIELQYLPSICQDSSIASLEYLHVTDVLQDPASTR